MRGIRFTLLACVIASSVFGDPIDYTYVNWSGSAGSTSRTAGGATGTLSTGGSLVSISYSGDLLFAETGGDGVYFYTPSSVYTNSQVANAPTNSDLLALTENYAGTNTLTFSSPLSNPILDLVSLGSPPAVVSYSFDATPVILSQGSAYFGGCDTCLSVSGNTLSGQEGSGVVEFVGSYKSISWTTTGGEVWNGFTLGVAGLGTPATATPEPSTFALLCFAVIALAAGVSRRAIKTPKP